MPRCGATHGVYATRERTRRHLDIWQYKTFFHCRLPRLDCGEDGPVTAEVPWVAPDAKHFTAPFEAQVLVLAMLSMPVAGMARVVREHGTRICAMLNRVVAKTHAKANYRCIDCHVIALRILGVTDAV